MITQILEYSDNEQRDDKGMWTSGGTTTTHPVFVGPMTGNPTNSTTYSKPDGLKIQVTHDLAKGDLAKGHVDVTTTRTYKGAQPQNIRFAGPQQAAAYLSDRGIEHHFEGLKAGDKVVPVGSNEVHTVMAASADGTQVTTSSDSSNQVEQHPGHRLTKLTPVTLKGYNG